LQNSLRIKLDIIIFVHEEKLSFRLILHLNDCAVFFFFFFLFSFEYYCSLFNVWHAYPFLTGSMSDISEAAPINIIVQLLHSIINVLNNSI